MCGHIQKLPVLVLAQVLIQIHVQGRTSVQVLDILFSVQLEFVHNREAIVLGIVEVRAVKIML